MPRGQGPQQILQGPDGIQLILDPTEVANDHHDDGHPALVRLRNLRATYQWATEEECIGWDVLTEEQVAWLRSHQDTVAAFLSVVQSQFTPPPST